MTDWTKTKDSQWMRKDENTYEMCQTEKVVLDKETTCWFAWHGIFELSDYDLDDIDWAIDTHDLPLDADDDEIAAALFENQGADFDDIEQYFAEEEAVAYIKAIIG